MPSAAAGLNRRLWALPLAGLLIWTLAMLLMRGLADAAGTLAELHIAAAHQHRRAPPADELRRVDGFVAVARAWDRGNPAWVAQQGRVREWQAYHAAGLGLVERAADYRSQGLALYRAGVAMRPLWAWAWLDLGYAKFRAGAIDDEFQLAFANADRTAPWLQRVQLSRVALGLPAWPRLSPQNRQALSDSLQRLGRDAPQGLIGLAGQPGSRFLICSFTRDASPRMAAFCGS